MQGPESSKRVQVPSEPIGTSGPLHPSIRFLLSISHHIRSLKMFVDTPGDFASKTFDFVIVGGGTAGLALAAKITEDPELTVGVLEAGQNRIVDPNILVPGRKPRKSFS